MSQQAVEINSSGAINGCSGIIVQGNQIDGMGLGGLGVSYSKCEAGLRIGLAPTLWGWPVPG
jgi:hypothetical protein